MKWPAGGPLHCGYCRSEVRGVSLPAPCPTCGHWLTVTMPWEIYRTTRAAVERPFTGGARARVAA